jgi:hypothetical protein
VARTYERTGFRAAQPCPVTGKASFRSTQAAREFVAATDWNREYARVYRCLICDWFHLTSQRTNWELSREALTNPGPPRSERVD